MDYLAIINILKANYQLAFFNKMKEIFVIIFILINSVSFSQITITGTVYSNNKSLFCVSVFAKNSKIGTISNTNGVFLIKLPYNKDTLYFSYIGYKTIIVPVYTDTNINVILQNDTNLIQEVLITDYTQKQLGTFIKYSKNKQLEYKLSSEITSKTYTKLVSVNNNIPIEYFEAFYSTQHNNLNIIDNTYKSGVVRVDKINKNDFITLDFFSYIQPKLNYFDKKEFTIKSPFLYSLVDEILYNYTLKYEYNTIETIKILFKSKNSASNSGYIILDKKNNLIKELYVNDIFKEKKPFEPVNSNFLIDTILISSKINFELRENINYPILIQSKFSFNYKTDNKVDYIQMNAIMAFIKFNSQFPKIIPENEQLSDYENLCIVPKINEIWENEPNVVRNEEDILFLENSTRISFNKVRYDVYTINWRLNLDLIRKKSRWWENSYNIEVFILLNYYKVNNEYKFTTNAVFDYNNSYFSLDFDDVASSFIDDIFEKTYNLSVDLKQKLYSMKISNENEIQKEYEIYSKRLKIELKQIDKSYQNKLFVKCPTTSFQAQ
jgi:hypothetical protein